MRPGILQGVNDLGVGFLRGVGRVWRGELVHYRRSILASSDIGDHRIPLRFDERDSIIPAVPDEGASIDEDADIAAGRRARVIVRMVALWPLLDRRDGVLIELH
jgi:hypothetical protein